jgi:hypothetical protein
VRSNFVQGEAAKRRDMNISQAVPTKYWTKLVKSEGQQNGIDIEHKHTWQQNDCSLRAFTPDIFAILLPQTCN